MWKRLWSNEALKMGMTTLVVRGRPPCWPQGRLVGTPESYFFSSSSSDDRNNRSKPEFAAEGHNMSFSEVKKLTRLVNVEALKKKLEMEQAEVINYIELLDACEEMGVARSRDEASSLARALDEAGVVLLFRDKVYLHPDKVAEVVRRAVPLVLNGEEEDEMRREELVLLQKKKDEIDAMAHKQVRRILWGVLGLGVVQVGLFFRLTFWEFSWDVMEPITFFTTSTGILMGYAYFLFTARDPSYQDFMQRLFVARQRKLFKLRNFNARRFKELRDKCTPANHHLPSQLNLVEVDDHHGR